ncbi:hypothetical protein [Roseitranquillus sediminis]|uniref:hypothetical protein n=1 Tax=Roseitranquillus sediminis TaxID=2809051 RepID=UPI001D0C8C0F|nr:hypothetical protein [Roseitranquillus sediminis]
MNRKHRKVLAAVFTDPVSGTIEWAAIEGLLLAACARLIEGRGSRVRFEKDGEVATPPAASGEGGEAVSGA